MNRWFSLRFANHGGPGSADAYGLPLVSAGTPIPFPTGGEWKIVTGLALPKPFGGKLRIEVVTLPEEHVVLNLPIRSQS